jgi:AraC family transcriptional regulator
LPADFCKAAVQHSSRLILPSELKQLPKPIMATQCPGLSVRHYQVSDEGEVQTPLTRHHTIMFLLGGAWCQNKIDDLSYEGTQQPGDVLLMPAGSMGKFYRSGPGSSLVFWLDPQLLQQVATTTNSPKPSQLELRPALHDRSVALTSLAQMFHVEMQQAQLGDNLYLESLTQLFAIQVLREYGVFSLSEIAPQKGLPPRQLQRAIDYIKSHLHENLQLAKIAEVTGFSTTYFCTLFRQSVGVTPHQYVLQQRIERAKLLLQQSQLELADIAIQCGFANQSHFTRHFRQIVGVTPKIYQRHTS